jgi:acetyltransferase-like isoleucine patch superfamily enzyme
MIVIYKSFSALKTMMILYMYKILRSYSIELKSYQKFAKGFSLTMHGKKSKLELNKCSARANLLLRVENGKLHIGKHVTFNNNCSINCLNNIFIGDNVMFGENVLIYDHNHCFNKKNLLIREQGITLGNVSIGNNCWIGSNSVILMNVEIGDNVIIGAGSVVTKSVPSNCVAFGNPCKSNKIK